MFKKRSLTMSGEFVVVSCREQQWKELIPLLLAIKNLKWLLKLKNWLFKVCFQFGSYVGIQSLTYQYIISFYVSTH